jgi:hypothetical protein
MERHHNQIRRRSITTSADMKSSSISLKQLGYLVCMLLLVGPGIARADGSKSLVLGSVHRIGKNYVEVEVQPKEIVAVKVDASTTYFDSGVSKPARPQDLGVGDQVAIRVVSKNGESVAEQIKFVPSNGPRKTRPVPKPQ